MNKDALVIANAICCDKDTYEKADVLIENGVITAVEANIKHNCKRIEAEGFTLMPAFVDLHAHFRDPGYTSKEDIFTGSMAALKGGYTTVNLMANTLPVCNDDHMVERIAKKVKIADLIDVYQSCSITKDFNGVDCNHIDSIESENCRIISDDGNGVESDTVMKKAMELAKKKGLIISSHAEYKELSKVDTRLSENHMTLRDLKLCEETGAHLHMAHVSTKEAVEMISNAKSKGLNVTCECTPHHLTLSDSTSYRVHPPLRKPEDIDALIQGIFDKTVDCIATDHAPHTKKDKMAGCPGMSSIEIAFSICYTFLVKTKKISLKKLSELMSFTPAKILGINKGSIKNGIKADLVLIDTSFNYSINPSDFLSKGKNTPFSGKKISGKVLKVIKDGIVRFDNGKFNERKG